MNPSFDFLHNLHSDGDAEFDIGASYDADKFDCNYSDLTNFTNLSRNNPSFTIMSLNIQSLSAKFSDLKDLICTLQKSNSSPDIICIQELWNFHSLTSFNLPGYDNLISKSRSNDAQGGEGGILR